MGFKISSRPELVDVLSDDVVGLYRPGSPNTDYRSKVSNLVAGMPQPVIDPVTLNGVDNTSTSVLKYGINVIRTSTNLNFAALLPLPQKGKTVTIINLSYNLIRVFPSQVGGSINGVVNGHMDIPNNGKAVQIVCYENPNPGDWMSPQANQQSSLAFGTFTINHTNGVQDAGHAINAGGVILSGLGGGTDGGGNLTLSPSSADWRTEPTIATVTKMKVYTNIVANDCPQDFNPGVNGIIVWRETAYKTGSNSSTIGQRESATFLKTGDPFALNDVFGSINGGVLNTPPEIGDAGTFYAEVLAAVNINNQIGIGGQYSSYWYSFGFQVAAGAITKLYKFKIVLEYF